MLRVFLFGDTDEGTDETPVDTLDAGPASVMRGMWLGGVNLPWNLSLRGLIGFALLFSRLTIGADPDLANAHHLIGFLALNVIYRWPPPKSRGRFAITTRCLAPRSSRFLFSIRPTRRDSRSA